MNAQDPDVQYHLAYALYKLQINNESCKMINELPNNCPDFDKSLDAIALNKFLQLPVI
jgi:hypothetical protein